MTNKYTVYIGDREQRFINALAKTQFDETGMKFTTPQVIGGLVRKAANEWPDPQELPLKVATEKKVSVRRAGTKAKKRKALRR